MKQITLLLTTLMICISVHAKEPANIIHHKFQSTDIYIRTGLGEHNCGGTFSISAFYYGFDEYIDAVIKGRNGSIINTWVIDHNNDNNPEIYVWIRSCGSGGYGELHAYQLLTYEESQKKKNRSEIKLVKITVPKPSQFLQNYRGHDHYQVTNDGIIRSFPQYNIRDPNANPTLEKLSLKFFFDTQQWQVINLPNNK